MTEIRKWINSGAPWVWLNAAAVSCCVLLVLGLLLLIAIPGFGHFWPTEIHQIEVRQADGSKAVLAGQVRDSETINAQRLRDSGIDIPPEQELASRSLIKTGNRDLTGEDFVWVPDHMVLSTNRPADLMLLERIEWGSFIGYLKAIKQQGQVVENTDVGTEFSSRLERSRQIANQIAKLQKSHINSVNYRLERLRLKQRALELGGTANEAAYEEIGRQRSALKQAYQQLESELLELNHEIQRDSVVMQTADGAEHELPIMNIVDAYLPNQLNLAEKLLHFLKKSWEFISEDPREANTEGGIFPAIFGTVLMVLLMSVFVTPLGVVAAVYLKEYAKQGMLTRIIRVAVNNLAGVPSIVYGVFGLGFFIYTLGGGLDRLFFAEALPSPTFGTGGLFWAALTLALLTLPVVIVSTEEGLARIPRSVREGSLALGATQWETLWRTVIPMASPGIMTGMILAVARAAGEVAPLMLVGVVKLAPSLPLDGNYPFLHLERKFMHLGFHIYDVGFQSPNVEAARPLVYATALLLVFVTILLNLTAIRVRNRLRHKYRGLES